MSAHAAFETTLHVPTRHLREIMSRLSRAGFTIMDTGERVATDDGFEAEATVRLLHVPTLELHAETYELGVSA